MSYTFDYSLLCERMSEYRHSQSSLANAIPISRTSINHKLKGKIHSLNGKSKEFANYLKFHLIKWDYIFNQNVRKTEQ